MQLVSQTWEQPLADSKKARTSVFKLRIECCLQPTELEMNPKLQVRWAVNPAEALSLDLWDSALTSDLQNCELKMSIVLNY